MQVSHIKTKIDGLKPRMKVVSNIEQLPCGNMVLTAKIDGEFSFLSYNRHGFTFILNKWGKMRTDFPALKEFTEAMNKTNVDSAEFLCELHARQDGEPLPLPQFLHYIKGNPPQLNKIHIAIFNMVKVNGETVKVLTESYHHRLQQAELWFRNCLHVQTVPYIVPRCRRDITLFWKTYVEEQHYEGVVATVSNQIFKIKPIHDLDVAIIGVNKTSGYGKQQVTSLHLALMTREGYYVEIGDVASGINHQLRSALWQLIDYKVGETARTVYVKPMVVVTVEYTSLFKSRNTVFKFTGNEYRRLYTMPLIRMRHPRLKHFRKDKQVNPQDLRLTQLPSEYLEQNTTT